MTTERDHNGERGPVPTLFRAHSWQVCAVIREASEAYAARLVARIEADAQVIRERLRDRYGI